MTGRKAIWGWLSASWLVGLFACSGSPPKPSLPAGCQPLLAGADCLLPYPSDFFLTSDASMKSGRRLEFGDGGRLRRASDSLGADPNELHAVDGFSLTPTLVGLLGSPVADRGLKGILDPALGTIDESSTTILLNPTTGEFVPHFVDLDPRATNLERQGIVLHPIVPLVPRTRYIVALRRLVQPNGAPALAPPGFARLRDRTARDDADLMPLVRRFDDEIFGPLEAHGVSRADLLLAWDFTTGSRESMTDDMRAIREATLRWLNEHTPTVQITSVDEDSGRKDVWREIHGKIEAPLFLAKDEPGASLVRDGSGQVMRNGTTLVPFTAIVPISVRDQFGPGMALEYGHGFFGRQSEVTTKPPRQIASRLRAVAIAIDWTGMSQDDVFLVVGSLADAPAEALRFVDRTHQAMANWIVLRAAISGPMKDVAAFRRPDVPSGPGVMTSSTTGESNRGDALYEDGVARFLGISQGHIMGGILAAMDPGLSRVVLNVGGGGFSSMMLRARPFTPFLAMLESSFPDALDQQKYIALTQTQLDRIDPVNYGPMVLNEPIPEHVPPKVLMQVGLGDVQVPNAGSFLHARSMGIPVLTPTPAEVYGLPTTPSAETGSALTLFDFGVSLDVYERAEPPALENVVHEGLRTSEPCLRQLEQFFRDGKIVQPCDGRPCRVP